MGKTYRNDGDQAWRKTKAKRKKADERAARTPDKWDRVDGTGRPFRRTYGNRSDD